MASARRGKFITFEGGDGTGKSTQIRLTQAWLVSSGHEVLLTREPGGTAIGEKIRGILLDPENAEMTDMTEMLLYAAARAQLAREVIQPALEAGTTVICDRWLDSSLVYQGAAKELGAAVAAVNAYATGGLEPDRTVLLDLDVPLALSRAAEAAGGRDRIEALGEDWHVKVRTAYLDLAARFQERICVVDAAGSPDEVHARVRTALAGVFAADAAGGA